MVYVPLYFEVIRARPVLAFWLASLAQATLWLIVPLALYGAPPGALAQALAVGHQFARDASVGPPLAFWLAEIVFRVGGLTSLYLLSQLCVVTAYWCVFRIGNAVFGPTHAVLAVLLMVGVAPFTVPTPGFGPSVLTMALWALVLWHYWQAVALKRHRAWYLLGGAAALILLTSEAALILIGTLGVFTAATARGRAALERIEPWIVAAVLVGVLFVHLLWLEGTGDMLTPTLRRLREAGMGGSALAWLRLAAVLVVAQTGLAVLALLAGASSTTGGTRAPALGREKVGDFARSFVTTLALAPAVLATVVAAVIGRASPVGGAAPLLLFSGLAVVLLAGERIALCHPRLLGFAWAGLLVLPALLVPVVMALLPWTSATDLAVAAPAAAMGRFFADSFQQRTGRPLAVVTGENGIASIVALGAPSHPLVYFQDDPQRSPSVSLGDIRRQGAVVVWPTADTTPNPPPAIKAVFPDLVAEVPQTFARALPAQMSFLHVGWGVIRPAAAAPGPATRR